MELFYFYPWLFPVLATLFGLIVGSFLNVVIYRLPKIMEREWRAECAASFPEYGITPPEGKLTSVCRVPLAHTVKRRFASLIISRY